LLGKSSANYFEIIVYVKLHLLYHQNDPDSTVC